MQTRFRRILFIRELSSRNYILRISRMLSIEMLLPALRLSTYGFIDYLTVNAAPHDQYHFRNIIKVLFSDPLYWTEGKTMIGTELYLFIKHSIHLSYVLLFCLFVFLMKYNCEFDGWRLLIVFKNVSFRTLYYAIHLLTELDQFVVKVSGFSFCATLISEVFLSFLNNRE